ncbi:MAG TPA: Lrp/AsnC family transcriptional regulator [Chloroflexota bacterium]|nr:Lrp/AsnC family transcriptional regulator [Chloroflexota bacterium]
MDGGARSKLDVLDRQIIALLQPDGRRPFADIAREVGVSEGTVRQRYQRLVNDGILQVVAVADPFKIGFHSMAMIGVNVTMDSARTLDDVADEIAGFREVSYVVMSTGEFDLLVEVIVENSEDLASFLVNRLHRVNGVAETETFVLLRVYKMNLGGWRMVEAARRLRETI